MKIKNKVLRFKTSKIYDFIDFTKRVKEFVNLSAVRNGIINIQIMNTSAGLILNEHEPLLLKDIKSNLEKISPSSSVYEHDDLTKRTVNVCEDECRNGHSHCNAIHLPATVTLNVVDGKVQFGQWQSIMLIELDSARERRVQLQILGE